MKQRTAGRLRPSEPLPAQALKGRGVEMGQPLDEVAPGGLDLSQSSLQIEMPRQIAGPNPGAIPSSNRLERRVCMLRCERPNLHDSTFPVRRSGRKLGRSIERRPNVRRLERLQSGSGFLAELGKSELLKTSKDRLSQDFEPQPKNRRADPTERRFELGVVDLQRAGTRSQGNSGWMKQFGYLTQCPPDGQIEIHSFWKTKNSGPSREKGLKVLVHGFGRHEKVSRTPLRWIHGTTGRVIQGRIGRFGLGSSAEREKKRDKREHLCDRSTAQNSGGVNGPLG